MSCEVWHQPISVGLAYKTFLIKLGASSCHIKHNNVLCTHLFAVKNYNIVLHAYTHNPWKFQVIWTWTFVVICT